ncbi:hypothetical protein BZA70DRAFT_193116 [Myxozyma melibiosi]|uniref:Uncharacterized protein n=1 Tax=Myxozyma melibiosi TaxID=54550 RepID=A0ABR1F5U5_9ASCO
MFSLDSYSAPAASSKSSKEPSGLAVAQILASLSSATIDVPRNYAVDFSSTSSSISIPSGLSSTSSCEEYTPSLSSSVSSISSLSSLRLSADSSPVLDTAAQRLAFLPLPQHSSQPTGDHKGLAAELQQQMLAVQRGSSPRRIPVRASMHRRHSASCSSSSSVSSLPTPSSIRSSVSSSSSSAPLSTSLPSSSVLAAKTNSAGRVSKSASLSGCSLPAYQSTVASLVKHAGKRGSFVSSLVGMF